MCVCVYVCVYKPETWQATDVEYFSYDKTGIFMTDVTLANIDLK